MGAFTIRDVADRAGVSIKTVSRVMNNEPYVRPETRERVMAVVAAMNYAPNISARALAGSRTYLIGLYFDDPSPDYVSQLQVGALGACQRHGYHLMVERIGRADPDFKQRLADLGSRVRVDGVILSPPLSDDLDLLQTLQANGTPVVRISPATALDQAAQVTFDDRSAAFEMTRHLIALGHRRIAFISGPQTHTAAARRRDGFQAAMAEAGLTIADAWMERGDFLFRSGSRAAERLLQGPSRPTAIFAANDDMALGVMAVAGRLQIETPRALSIVGFDDSPSAQVVWPQLSTVRQPVAQMAAAAVDLLIESARGQAGAPMAREMDFALVLRDSTAPPPLG